MGEAGERVGDRRELQAKDREIEIYKQQNPNIIELTKLGARNLLSWRQWQWQIIKPNNISKLK